MPGEKQPLREQKLDDFLQDLNSQLYLTQNTSQGWFGVLNTDGISLETVQQRIEQTAAENKKQSVVFEYPLQLQDKKQWFDCIEQTAGKNAPLIILKPTTEDVETEYQKAEHLYQGLQGYALSVRNKISESGHGVIVLAPDNMDSLTFGKQYRTCIDLANVVSLYADLAQQR